MPPKHSAKIPLSDIAKLEQLIAQEPARAPSEVSKRQAVAMLAAKLYEMRHKGYAWRDVAAWLSGHGLTMTAATLQRHLRGIKDAGARGGPRGRAKGPGDGEAGASRAFAATTPAPAAPTAPPPKVSPPPGPVPVEPKARDLEPPKGAPAHRTTGPQDPMTGRSATGRRASQPSLRTSRDGCTLVHACASVERTSVRPPCRSIDGPILDTRAGGHEGVR